MMVAGGTYGEVCRYPVWQHIYGSGLRAALAVSAVSPATHLHTFAPSAWYDDIEATLAAVGLNGTLIRVDTPTTFGFLHPFELIEEPTPPEKLKTIEVIGDVVLRFGMIEGDAKVMGRRAVYDPQSETASFFSNGSHVDELAMIVTRRELMKLANDDVESKMDLDGEAGERALSEAVIDLFDLDKRIAVILVKDGLGGLLVFQGDDSKQIESYSAESYFRIGSGDVLAAAFAYAWGEKAMGAVQAADYAARCLAFFVEGPRLPIPDLSHLSIRRTIKARTGHIRILTSGDDIELQSLVLHTKDWITHLGGTVILEILGSIGIVDPGVAADLVVIGSRSTKFELEETASRLAASRPVVVYWPGEDGDVAEHYFPGSEVTNDYATALYRTMRTFAL